MGCNCRKNRPIYTGPPAPPASVTESTSTFDGRSTAGGQPVITSDAVVADASPSTSSR